MEYVTKKVPKHTAPLIRELAARCTLARGRRVTEAEVISEAVDDFMQKPVQAKRVKHSLMDLSGIITGGPRTNSASSKAIDDVVYGDLK